MPDPLTLKITPSRVQVTPGGQGAATVTVTNRTEEVGHYRLSAAGLPAAWFELSPDQLSAFPLEDTQAQLIVRPPAGSPAATFHLTVCAALQEQGFQARAVFDVDVPFVETPVEPPPPPRPAPAPSQPAPVQPAPVTPVAPAGPAPEPTRPAPPPPEPARPAPPPAAPQTPTQTARIQLTAEPVKEAAAPMLQWRLTLCNAGTVLDTLSFSITGMSATWATVEPPEVGLEPGEKGSVLLTVRPPDSAPARTYPFTIRAFSHLNPDERTEIPLKAEVRPRAAFLLALAPRDAQSQGAKDYRVTLTSDPSANTDLWIDLSAADDEDACAYTFDPAVAFLPARGTAGSTLRVTPRQPLPAGEQRMMFTFTVTGVPREGLAAKQKDTGRLTLIAAAPVSLNLRPKTVTGDQQGEYTVIAANPSGVDATVTLVGEDPEAACEFVFEPPRLALAAGATTQGKLTVRALDAYEGTGQKEHRFTVTATRQGDILPTARAEGAFVQRSVSPITITLVPPQQSTPGRAQFVVRAANPRNQPVELLLAASDEADALNQSFSPPVIRLSPGAEGQARLNIRPKDRLMPGEQRRVHRFTVTAQAGAQAATATASGVLAQVRGFDMPRVLVRLIAWAIWLLKWAAVGGLVLLVAQFSLGVLDYLSLSRPGMMGLRQLLPGPLVQVLQAVPTFEHIVRPIIRALTGS